MAKTPSKKPPQQGKYDKPIKINGTFEQFVKKAANTPINKGKNPKK